MDLIWNGNFQSLFLSPLIGAVMGLILAYLFTPSSDYRTNINITYSQVIKFFLIEVHHHYHGSRPEDGGAFGFAFVLMGVSAWLYLDYGQITLTALIFVAAFIVAASAGIISTRLSVRSGDGWLFRLVWPVVVATLAVILILRDQVEVDYLKGNGISFHYFVSSFGSDFFTAMLYHIAGIPFLVGALSFSIVAILHYVALGTMISPESIDSFRGWIVRKTFRFGRPSGNAMQIIHALNNAAPSAH